MSRIQPSKHSFSSSPTILIDDSWLDDTEEQMQAEDAQWETTQVRHRDGFSALIVAARAEIDADATQSMFTENGEFLFD